MATELAFKPRPAEGGIEPRYRILPHNMEAEQGLLGALLVDNRALEKVNDFLKAIHFYVPAHQRIYEAIVKLADRGQSASPVTLKTYFEQDADLTQVGGAEYLADLAATAVTIINTNDYARTIYDLYLRRSLIALGEEIVNQAYEQNVERDATKAIEVAESRLFTLAETGDVRGGFVTLKDSVAAALQIADRARNSEGRLSGVTTGFIDLDEMLGGLHRSDLLILAGRPSMGKTALATNIAFSAAEKYFESGGTQGAIVGMFSLEMSSDQLATRILAEQSNISSDSIRKGNISADAFREFVSASQKLSQIPLYIDDTPALSISALRTRARRLKRQHGLGLLVVDYLQLLQGTGTRQSEMSRVIEISEITRGLKAIAKELEIPVLALSQLSRAVEMRDDKRPQLSDLRESGSIEQDSDVVMFVYRKEYYLERQKPDGDKRGAEDDTARWEASMARAKNGAECIISKQRHGPIGTVLLHFEPNFTRFSNSDADFKSRYFEGY